MHTYIYNTRTSAYSIRQQVTEVCVYMCAYIYIYVYVYLYVCIYVYIYMYIYSCTRIFTTHAQVHTRFDSK